MKILQLGKFYPIKGGVEKVMYELMCGLSERGIRCDMMCAAPEGGSHITRMGREALMLHCRTLKKYASTMISPSMIAFLRKIKDGYDIIHIHHPDPMACLALFLSGYKGKVILHWHSDILKQKRLLKLYMPLQKWLVRRADLIVGTTPVYLKESPHLQQVQDKTVCLPIGILPMAVNEAGAQRIRQEYGGRKIVFSLGRLVEYKGYRHLVEAASYLGDDYVILIGGTGPLHDELQARIRELHVEEKVRLLGFVSDEELPAYYGACSMFCLPSVYKTEAFGIVQIEAMSCGRPVVTTRIPQSGVPWVNADQVSGINVEPGNAKALAEAIVQVAGDEERWAAFCRRAEERYHRLFTKEKMIADCIAIYSRVLRG